MIPKGLHHEHFKQAATEIDRNGVPAERRSVYYDLVIEGKRYPPKYIVSLAAKFATGEEHLPADFNAVEAKKFFLGKGYEVVDRRAKAEDVVVDEDDESAFPEGRESFKIHRQRERDGKMPRKAKEKRLAETKKLECDICGMDFHSVYGKLGYGFIEAHHTVPVSKLNGAVKTKLDDLALVCSNCHRMLHRGSTLLTIEELKKLVQR
ncbi:HNH endonuclease [Ferrovum myxofaciens]|uniref:HNH endonuclease n=1 Tax=Ferrovum myxofaciens TaxID=416213 RepID=UPI00068D93A4|nr:HNH endonuclease [Ferrovum myxofaciens]MBU6994425.1 HNH endonuclease [Ferrovum myxofaciens]